MSKREESTKETKGRIFKASAKLFALRGYDGASMREIAKEADVNLALINYHFKDKQQLFVSVIEYGLSLWGQLLEAYRGESLEKILRALMKHTTDSTGTAYYMNIFLRLFMDTREDLDYKRKLMEGIPKIEIIQEAVAREMGKEQIDKDVMIVTYYLTTNMIFTSRIKFGASENLRDRSFIKKLFSKAEDPYTDQLLFLAKRLCEQFA